MQARQTTLKVNTAQVYLKSTDNIA